MDWLSATLDALEALPTWSYRSGGEAATEPTAWAALALAAHGRHDAAKRAQQWLLDHQGHDGSLGISASQDAPHWPTGISVLAWAAYPRYQSGDTKHPFHDAIQKAVRWMFTLEGKPNARNPDLGHDTTLVGWPWVEGTHTWLEPTALYLLALKGVGQRQHVRAREAVKILLDRQLPSGGCNYGNTFVLGQELRPHLEPSGLALWALGGEQDATGRIAKTLDYLTKNASDESPAMSLSYAMLGLATHNRFPATAPEWLGKSLARADRHGPSPHRMALASLAALGTECPLVKLTQEERAP